VLFSGICAKHIKNGLNEWNLNKWVEICPAGLTKQTFGSENIIWATQAYRRRPIGNHRRNKTTPG